MSSEFQTEQAALGFTSGSRGLGGGWLVAEHSRISAHECATPFQKWTVRAMHPPATVREYDAAGKYKTYQK